MFAYCGVWALSSKRNRSVVRGSPVDNADRPVPVTFRLAWASPVMAVEKKAYWTVFFPHQSVKGERVSCTLKSFLVCCGSHQERGFMNSCREPGQQPLPVSLCWHLAALGRSLHRERVGTMCGAGQSCATLDGEQEGDHSLSTNLMIPGRIELHFLRNTIPQATAGFILPDLSSVP